MAAAAAAALLVRTGTNAPSVSEAAGFYGPRPCMLSRVEPCAASCSMATAGRHECENVLRLWVLQYMRSRRCNIFFFVFPEHEHNFVSVVS